MMGDNGFCWNWSLFNVLLTPLTSIVSSLFIYLFFFVFPVAVSVLFFAGFLKVCIFCTQSGEFVGFLYGTFMLLLRLEPIRWIRIQLCPSLASCYLLALMLIRNKLDLD
jgi:hypothetical protein